MIERQLSVFLANKPGVLAEVCRTLSAKDVNIRGLSISDTVDHSVVRMVVDDPQKALHVLGERGTLVVETDVLAVELPNKAAALASLADKLAEVSVNIEYAYGSTDGSEGLLFLRVSDIERAQSVAEG